MKTTALTALSLLLTGILAAQQLTWQTVTSGTTTSLDGVAFGNGQFIAVGSSTSNTNIATNVGLRSTDGINWQPITLPAGLQSAASVSFGSGIFMLAIGGPPGPTSTRVLTSPDGVNWTARTTPSATDPVAKSGFFSGSFYVVGLGANTLIASVDAANWISLLNLPAGSALRGITDSGQRLVAVGLGSAVYTSDNGTSWTQRTFSKAGIALSAVAHGNGVYVAVGTDNSTTPESTYLATSPDGITWIERTGPPGRSLFNVIFANGTFVAAGAFSPSASILASSTDGVTWNATNLQSITSRYVGLAFGQNRFVAVGEAGGIAIANTGPTAPGAPTITGQPSSQTVQAGGLATFNVVASGTNLTYQWSFNGTAINGATASSHAITNAQAANAGNYSVVVTNASGSVTSNNATLTVNPVVTPPPTTPPASGGGGGGGGAPSAWFLALFIALSGLRILTPRSRAH